MATKKKLGRPRKKSTDDTPYYRTPGKVKREEFFKGGIVEIFLSLQQVRIFDKDPIDEIFTVDSPRDRVADKLAFLAKETKTPITAVFKALPKPYQKEAKIIATETYGPRGKRTVELPKDEEIKDQLATSELALLKKALTEKPPTRKPYDERENKERIPKESVIFSGPPEQYRRGADVEMVAPDEPLKEVLSKKVPDRTLKTALSDFGIDRDNDPVNHPDHYADGKIEVIDFIHDKLLGFDLGNAVKYIARAGKKDPTKYVEDLKKAIWYINARITDYEKNGK